MYMQWSFRAYWFVLILIAVSSTNLVQSSSPPLDKGNLPNPGYYNFPTTATSEESSADDDTGTTTTTKDKPSHQHLIDLRFNTAIKCLLLGPPQIAASTRRHTTHNARIQDDDSGSQPEPLFPIKGQKHAHIFATAERRHETNYLGMLFRWKRSMATKSNNNDKKVRGPLMTPPTTTDFTSEWTLDGNLDSVSLRLDWGNSGGDADKYAQNTNNDNPIVEVRANNALRLTQLGCRFPIFFRRLHVWSIVHLPWNSDSYETPIFHNGPIHFDQDTKNANNNDEWWIPNIVVDPMGMVTTDNQYTKPLHRQSHQQSQLLQHQDHLSSSSNSLVKVRLRLRSRLSILSSAVMGSPPAGGGGDDDDGALGGSTIMFLECSHIDTRYCRSTTGRLEVPLELSILTNWRNNKQQNPLFADSRLSIIHERLITNTQTSNK